MLSLEGTALQSARKSTSTMLLMLGSTEANRSKADEQAQVEIPSDLSEALDEHRYEIGEGEVPF
jgi:hypothetical protein